MKAEGNLKKMRTEQVDETIHYFLNLNDEEIRMDHYLGKHLSLVFKNQINCIACSKTTKTSFGQGFCYTCFMSAPEAEPCVLHPEKCKAHLGNARDMEYARHHCLIPHYVYLAESSIIKVGVTRHHQIPTRWIDQGARKAIILAETPNRHMAGIIEVFLKKYYSDKTNWKAMLKGEHSVDNELLAEKKKAIKLLPTELSKYVMPDDAIREFNYPHISTPLNPTSVNLEKTGIIEGILSGIKGQYLIFEQEEVINIRKYSGYLVDLEIKE